MLSPSVCVVSNSWFCRQELVLSTVRMSPLDGVVAKVVSLPTAGVVALLVPSPKMVQSLTFVVVV